MDPEKPNFNQETPSQEQDGLIKSEKEIAWEQKLMEVNEIADRLGKRVDEKIKKPIAAFLIHEFTTSGSCEGHIAKEGQKQHGLPYPWIEVRAPEPEGWKNVKDDKKEQLDQEWRIKNFKQQRKMMEFFKEFYKGRETPFDARLAFDKVGVFGGFRVQSFGAEMTVILTPEEKKQKLELYRKEIEDFTNFLKSKYFSKE